MTKTDTQKIYIRERGKDGRSKSIGLYELKTLLSLLPLLYRFSEGYSESLHLHMYSRDKNVQKSKIHSLTYEKTTSKIEYNN